MFAVNFNDSLGLLDLFPDESDHACKQAFDLCQRNSERLFDKGYQTESNDLFKGCIAASALCWSGEEGSKANPFTKHTINFPPDKNRNGGGFVTCTFGICFFNLPTSDPVGEYPPKN